MAHTQMSTRNAQLKNALGAMAPKQRIVESKSLPKEDTRNRQGYAAYSLSDELRLISMLNTLKLQPQFYRTENEILKELRDLVERIGVKDPYFVAQAIVYSRCMGEGMRSINQLAAMFLAPFASGQTWAKHFYGPFNKKTRTGGYIFRLDDMSESKDIWAALNEKSNGKMIALPAAVKKGWATVLETAPANLLAKYKQTVIDIANLVHANSANSKAVIELNDVDFLAYKNAILARAKRKHQDAPVLTSNVVKVIDAIMSGVTVKADTWESENSDAGQIVAKAVKEGKISKDEATQILAEAKADNWEALLTEGKLGVLAALRNIRNIMKTPRKATIDTWCALITDAERVRKALILPAHFDLAYEVVMEEFGRADYSPTVQQALLKGYENAIPNLAQTMTGKTCVFVDCSGSMHTGVAINGVQKRCTDTTTCVYKAALTAATIAKATGADIVRFGSNAEMFNYDKNLNVFALAKTIMNRNMGGTNLSAAFDLIRSKRKAYDRIVILSDNEINGNSYWGGHGVTSPSYSQYIHDVCSPYIYEVDLAAYGTMPIRNDAKVFYYYGYGSALYDDMASKEFNPNMHIDKVRAVVIDPSYRPAA